MIKVVKGIMVFLLHILLFYLEAIINYFLLLLWLLEGMDGIVSDILRIIMADVAYDIACGLQQVAVAAGRRDRYLPVYLTLIRTDLEGYFLLIQLFFFENKFSQVFKGPRALQSGLLRTKKRFASVLQNIFSSTNVAANVLFLMFMHSRDPILCWTPIIPQERRLVPVFTYMVYICDSPGLAVAVRVYLLPDRSARKMNHSEHHSPQRWSAEDVPGDGFFLGFRICARSRDDLETHIRITKITEICILCTLTIFYLAIFYFFYLFMGKNKQTKRKNSQQIPSLLTQTKTLAASKQMTSRSGYFIIKSNRPSMLQKSQKSSSLWHYVLTVHKPTTKNKIQGLPNLVEELLDLVSKIVCSIFTKSMSRDIHKKRPGWTVSSGIIQLALSILKNPKFKNHRNPKNRRRCNVSRLYRLGKQSRKDVQRISLDGDQRCQLSNVFEGLKGINFQELLPIPSCMNGFVKRRRQVEKKGRKKPEEDGA
ncbi:hypothetical protein VP01_1933g1 [Puccinia sorghi]|uniref:Uncharacterized protein n=1 Tax=Puccinia sorghi TaxID=27349 RepID=A0A0L6VCB9_9BASI|nr:hypothetical protein VP01_1933g1 [Puccinia sorghi]